MKLTYLSWCQWEFISRPLLFVQVKVGQPEIGSGTKLVQLLCFAGPNKGADLALDNVSECPENLLRKQNSWFMNNYKNKKT
jgi:hypothetical protein